MKSLIHEEKYSIYEHAIQKRRSYWLGRIKASSGEIQLLGLQEIWKGLVYYPFVRFFCSFSVGEDETSSHLKPAVHLDLQSQHARPSVPLVILFASVT